MYIYRILTKNEFYKFKTFGFLESSTFFHCSMKNQIPEIIKKKYSISGAYMSFAQGNRRVHRSPIYILKLTNIPNKLVKFETASNGKMYPHLYGSLYYKYVRSYKILF